MRQKVLAAILVGGFLPSIPCLAATTLTAVAFPTPTASAFVTYTVTATSDAGDIIGFDFDNSTTPGFGVSGDLRHIRPFGIPWIFDDDVPPELLYAVSVDTRGDTQFLMRRADGVVANAFESSDLLSAAFTLDDVASAGPTLPFAQIVILANSAATYRGEFLVQTPGGVLREAVSGFVGVPEPATAALALGCIGMAAGLVRSWRRPRSASALHGRFSGHCRKIGRPKEWQE